MVPRTVKELERLIVDSSPGILTGLGIVGTLTTAVLASKASFRAALQIDEDERVHGVSDDPMQRLKERTLLVWKLYIPAAGCGVLTVVCITTANRVGTRRAAAMAAAYTISEKAYQEYREQVVKKFGEHKERAVRDEVAQKRVNDNPVSDSQIIMTGTGEVLCYEAYTGRYFNSSMEIINKAVNTINFRMNNDGYASLSDFFHEIGLPGTSYSDDIGWRNDALLELKFSTTLAEDGRPCIVIDYRAVPVRDYYRFA
jgi:hypothetical protein